LGVPKPEVVLEAGAIAGELSMDAGISKDMINSRL